MGRFYWLIRTTRIISEFEEVKYKHEKECSLGISKHNLMQIKNGNERDNLTVLWWSFTSALKTKKIIKILRSKAIAIIYDMIACGRFEEQFSEKVAQSWK